MQEGSLSIARSAKDKQTHAQQQSLDLSPIVLAACKGCCCRHAACPDSLDAFRPYKHCIAIEVALHGPWGWFCRLQTGLRLAQVLLLSTLPVHIGMAQLYLQRNGRPPAK